MDPKIRLFPVGNGDTTLITTAAGKFILMDVNIRAAADDDNDNTFDVCSALKQILHCDEQGRHYVDAFALSHPDKDHCTGLSKHFHLGPPDEYPKNSGKILIREMWSSPMVFRRASEKNPLCKDAKAFNTEAKRRVEKFRSHRSSIGNGDRILILGEDKDGKTDDLQEILVNVKSTITKINGEYDDSFKALLLAPISPTDADEEKMLSKNNSSVILQIKLGVPGRQDACRFLTGGDAEVEIWEKLLSIHEISALQYNVLQAPHHCSWHSLSHDSWSECKEAAKVSVEARKALSQALKGALIIASSNSIKDDDNDPPCIRAKREYSNITDINGNKIEFLCVGDKPEEILEIKVTLHGPQIAVVPLIPAGGGGGGSRPYGEPTRHG